MGERAMAIENGASDAKQIDQGDSGRACGTGTTHDMARPAPGSPALVPDRHTLPVVGVRSFV